MTYITIDLDYWDNDYELGKLTEGKYFLKWLMEKRKDLYIVEEHHHILDHIQSFPDITKIINIDFHSDIANEPVDELNEGTWANFVNKRETMTFEWRMPSMDTCLEKGYGRCDDGVFVKKIDRSLLGYKKIIFSEGIDQINFEKAVGISISKSDDWTYGKLNGLLKRGV
jgi:hypothetical protein